MCLFPIVSLHLAVTVLLIATVMRDVSAFAPASSRLVSTMPATDPTATTKTTTTTATSLRVDTRLYGLFSNRYQSSFSASSSSLPNSTDSSNFPSNDDKDKETFYNANNTSTTVLELNGDDSNNLNGDPTTKVILQATPKNGKTVTPTNNESKNNGHVERKVPPFFREGNNNPTGIGGQGGVTYNVNALKRNLLQETVRAYKMELLALLQSPSASEDVICQKLAALVQASPLRTTTDSNLLQAGGVRWTLCYQSRFTTVSNLRQPPPPLIRNNHNNNNSNAATGQPTVSPAMRRVAGKELSLTRSLQRSFHLESLPNHRRPHVVDHESDWGGLVRSKKIYSIKALTRTSLNLQLESSQRWVLGRLQPPTTPQSVEAKKRAVTANLPIDLTIIYSDTDLCIMADPDQKTYQVYTQADAWQSTQLARQLRFLVASFWYRLTHWSGESSAASQSSRSRRERRLLNELQLNQDLLDEESRLIVWQLGAGDDDEEAWESRKDPFVHLSADDRQRILKAMSVRQVREAGQEYASHQKRARFLSFSWLPRRTHFRRPKLERSRRQQNFKKPQ